VGEHSTAPRKPASAVPSITGLRISPPGFKATLVDISASGLLAELAVPLKIGQVVTVNFEGRFEPQSVKAHVVRSSVASMTAAGVRYHVGLAFMAAIALDDTPPEADAANHPAPAAAPDLPQPDDIVNQW
jgi:PilZ domain-containing protein